MCWGELNIKKETNPNYFWSEYEIEKCEKTLIKYNNIRRASEELVKELDRPLDTIKIKLYSIKKKLGLKTERGYIKSIAKTLEVKDEGIELPDGFTCEFVPSKVTLHKNYFKVFL